MDNNFSPTHTNNDNNDALFDPSRFSSSSSTGNQDNSIPELTFNPPAMMILILPSLVPMEIRRRRRRLPSHRIPAVRKG